MRQEDPPILSARFANATEVELIKKAAKALGLNPSAFIRGAALARASEIAERPLGEAKRRRILNQPKLTVIPGGKR
jgi:uncharacterized protein (DUF1778 family)